jgi:hypothetical protein
VQYDLAALSELAVDDPQQSMTRRDVVAIKADRLAEPHPGDCHQPDQRLVRRRVQRAPQLGRRVRRSSPCRVRWYGRPDNPKRSLSLDAA